MESHINECEILRMEMAAAKKELDDALRELGIKVDENTSLGEQVHRGGTGFGGSCEWDDADRMGA